ncbi:MAG: Uma2 family endonuclease [Deltaproteobacteria bacterium]|nr:Uma2 family endonuclease [Deltaproteobacteria bacterium]
METQRHRDQMNLLVDSLIDAWRDRTDFYAAGNMGLYFSETQARRNDFRAPDVFVVLETDRKERKRWVVWEEDGRTPDVIIEITSESTEAVDRGTKKDVYARVLRVPFYAIYDPFSARLDAFRLAAGRRSYEPLAPDEHGRVFCEPLGLWLGVVRGVRRGVDAPWLRWVDADGRPLPEDWERAAQERELAQRETERAERETERAERETERAQRETERAERAEAELRRLQEELRRRGG